MNFDAIREVALKEMQDRVTMKDRADIVALQESIAIAISKAIEEYDKKKNG